MHEDLVRGQAQALFQRVGGGGGERGGAGVEPGQGGVDLGGGLEFVRHELQGHGASGRQFGDEIAWGEGVLGSIEAARQFHAAVEVPVPVGPQLDAPGATAEMDAGSAAIGTDG